MAFHVSCCLHAEHQNRSVGNVEYQDRPEDRMGNEAVYVYAIDHMGSSLRVASAALLRNLRYDLT
ncbi:hypothetical protein CDL15_Pgr001578 [Punica granatum]|uniref:Uncharacterized protein n=1 Tax=Punica granatum TaxID=22663 RepID=A0A218X9U9_PUNGR|nr:hypothetical protein CDL15_Pgr001578 [Punica granatum]